MKEIFRCTTVHRKTAYATAPCTSTRVRYRLVHRDTCTVRHVFPLVSNLGHLVVLSYTLECNTGILVVQVLPSTTNTAVCNVLTFILRWLVNGWVLAS